MSVQQTAGARKWQPAAARRRAEGVTAARVPPRCPCRHRRRALKQPGSTAAAPVETGLEAARRRIAEECAAGPEAGELHAAPFLSDWAFDAHPRLGGPVLRGRVYGHPDIEDGSRITTSHLAAIDGAGAEWARTMSRYYRLGRREEEALH